MKIVFFGTPDYVMPILTSLQKKFVAGLGKSPIAAVVTQPPKPVGRKQYISFSPVDKWAHEHKISTFYSAKDLLKENLDFEVGVLASYGEIIAKEVINLFPQGILVIHPSLLPKFRWGSPIPAAIVTNTNPTGVSIIEMDDKFDHGPIVVQMKEEVLPDDTTESLRRRLFEKSALLLTESIEPYLKGKIKLKDQKDGEATYARIFTKEEAFISLERVIATLKGEKLPGEWEIPFIKDFSMVVNPENTDRFIRAMRPWPSAWTVLPNEKRLKLIKSHVGAGGKLVLDEVQLEGKLPVSWTQFIQAYPCLI